MRRLLHLLGIALFVVVVNVAVDVLQHRAAAGPVASGNGDTNGDGSINLADAVHLLAYIFEGGPEPVAIAGPPTLTPEQAEILGHLSIEYIPTEWTDHDSDPATDPIPVVGSEAKTIRATGVNIQIVNGLGATNGYPTNPYNVGPTNVATNGLGNLIIGYAEEGQLIDQPQPPKRTGSHCILLGVGNQHESHSAIVGGNYNLVSSQFGCAFGGVKNTVAKRGGVTIGGFGNVVSGYQGAACAGSDNVVSGNYSSACSGRNNTATAIYAAVVGGQENEASNVAAVAVGGFRCEASGDDSVTVGGEDNCAVGDWSVACGGGSPTASTAPGNTAQADYSFVAGGRDNEATAIRASVFGGQANNAAAFQSVVVGGTNNSASGDNSVISGGYFNAATGENSTVSGGVSRSVSGFGDWRAGSLFEDQ